MEFSKLLEELGMNAQEVLERFGGNKNLLQRFLCKFPTEGTFHLLTAAYQEGNLEAAEAGVHTLKGIAANLGFEALRLDCASMLDDLRGPKEHLAEEFERISQEYERLVSLIKTYLINSNQ